MKERRVNNRRKSTKTEKNKRYTLLSLIILCLKCCGATLGCNGACDVMGMGAKNQYNENRYTLIFFVYQPNI